MKEKIALVQGDITAVEADAIVNPANSELVHGGGLAGVLATAGGEQIQEDSDQIGPIAIGEAAVTRAGKLKCTYLIHAASMSLGGRTSETTLRAALTNAYRRASELNIQTIAFPSVGTGYGGYPVEKAAQIQMECAHDFLSSHPNFQKITFVLHSADDFQAFQSAYNSSFNSSDHGI
ncbi:MAG: macro domain-containing protein [Candidatus Kerfeldbacteria bacterium]|nr:macro domain-containing protein [Candidatus Kerfeldbacteria bacterium]